MSNGKGSKPRPLAIKREEYAANWDAVFKKRAKVDTAGILPPQQKIKRPPTPAGH